MDYTTLTPEGIEAQTLTPAQTQSLYEVCRQIVDGRAARGKQYELAGLLIVLVLAKLAGMKSLLGASEWARDQQKRLCQQLKLCWKQMPCANTYKYAASSSGESTGECAVCSMVGAQRSRKPLRRRTESSREAVQPTQCPPGHRWQSPQGDWKTGVWGREAAEAYPACV